MCELQIIVSMFTERFLLQTIPQLRIFTLDLITKECFNYIFICYCYITSHNTGDLPLVLIPKGYSNVIYMCPCYIPYL